MTTLWTLIEAALKWLKQNLPKLITQWLGTAGQDAANAVVLKMYKQETSDFTTGAPTAVGTDGKTNVQRLAQDGFLEFRHYLRAGNGSYPGAPEIPHLDAGADFIYEDGDFRTQIHNWCNTAATNLLANPTTFTASVAAQATPAAAAPAAPAAGN